MTEYGKKRGGGAFDFSGLNSSQTSSDNVFDLIKHAVEINSSTEHLNQEA